MPTYQYRCTACGNELEVVQKFSDPALSDCPDCTGQLRKVFNAVGVVFKGSGFYRTDSRADKKSDSGSESGTTTTEKKPAETSSSEKSTSKQPVAAGSSGDSGSSSKASSTAA